MQFCGKYFHTTRVTLILAAILVAFHAQTTVGAAQSISPATGGGTASSAKPAHASEGLVFAINSVRVNRDSLFIQYAIQNTTNQRQYVILFGSGSASTDNGIVGAVIGQETTGISHCYMQKDRDEVGLQDCKAGRGPSPNGGGSNIENYTYIEPGDVAQASMVYSFMYQQGSIQQAKTVSLKFMALVRTANCGQDALCDPAKTASQPRVVNINFPFVPLHN